MDKATSLITSQILTNKLLDHIDSQVDHLEIHVYGAP